ncbi:MAG TPA: DUF2273 domain-containing protein [bacterium]|jgi:uncharacterized membrane protein|nr:DUF2273 domain-containing protein [bacterium]
MANFWSDFLIRHTGKIIFSVLGLVFGLTVLSKGLFAACFLLLCLIAGYMVGKRVDQGERLTSFLEKIFPP